MQKRSHRSLANDAKHSPRRHFALLALPIAGLSAEKQALAERYIRQLAQSMDYVGTITLELFETEDGLVGNEVAPRVHNSGHWSIEGAQNSQFRNHILAISGRKVGSTAAIYPAVAMINAISAKNPHPLPHLPHAHYHSYGKEARPNRKLGHCTCGERRP